MAKDEELAETTGEEEAPAKKSPLKLIIILVVGLVVLGGGGFFAYKFFLAKPQPAATEQGQAAGGQDQAKDGQKPGEAGVVYPLDPFIVNLADPLGNRYLKVKLVLDLGSPEVQAEVEKKIPQLRDTILLLLSSKLLAEVNSMEGKLKLRSELLNRINQLLTKGRVATVYFTEFVIQ